MQTRPEGLLIGGAWQWPAAGETLPVEDPSTGQAITSVGLGRPADVDAAIAAARRASDEGPWPAMAPAERARILRVLADRLQAETAHFARLCEDEVGAPTSSVEVMQVTSAMPQVHDAIERAARGLDEALLPVEAEAVGEVIVREPRGVVVAMAPWNAPHVLQLHQVVPALATGNTLVVKPALETPSCALDLGLLALEAGVPPGVLNVVTGGPDVGQAMVADPRVDMVTFVGSSGVGIQIAQSAAASLKRVLLELGGKSAMIVLPDADVDQVVALACSYTWFSGEGCGLMTRLIVPDALHDEIVGRVAEASAALAIGSAHDPATVVGPLISAAHRDRVERYVQAGLEEGAELVIGGGRPDVPGAGYYAEPTIFTSVTSEMRIAQEEIFGPVLSVLRYDGSPEAAVALANDSQYGLTGGIFTRDRVLGLKLARAVKSGRVNVNNWVFSSQGPFGGYKRSGIGRSWGRLGLEEYTEVKHICWS